LSMSSRYAVTMFTDATRRSQKSLGLYTQDICPSCMSVSPCVATGASSTETTLIQRLVIECIARISIASRLCFPGLRIS
jgi:hypothetical protein